MGYWGMVNTGECPSCGADLPWSHSDGADDDGSCDDIVCDKCGSAFYVYLSVDSYIVPKKEEEEERERERGGKT